MSIISVTSATPVSSSPIPVAVVKSNTSADVIAANDAVNNLSTAPTSSKTAPAPTDATTATTQVNAPLPQPAPVAPASGVYNALASANAPTVRGSAVDITS